MLLILMLLMLPGALSGAMFVWMLFGAFVKDVKGTK